MRRTVLTLLLSFGLAGFAAPPAHATAALDKIGLKSAMPGSFADVVEKLLPAVVNISSTQKIKPSANMPQGFPMPPGMEGTPFDDFFRDFFEQYGQGLQKMPQQMVPASSLGSGFIIDADKGYVITNNHVVADADEVRVTLHDDTSLPATVVGRDEKVDIAVLQVKTDKKLTAVKFGDSGRLRVGDWVLAIGNPFGLGGTVTAGIVSAESRNINAGPYDDFIQTDASINRGNSGGPMFNTDGEVIGINTAIFSPSGGSVGIGFALPSNLVKPVVAQILKYGHTRRGWLGVRIQSITQDISDSLKLDGVKGALIASVSPGSPADKAGLKPGDVILQFDGKDINAMRTLPRTVAETEIGRKVAVSYWRDGRKNDTSVMVGELEKAEKDGATGEDDQSSSDPGDATPGKGISVSGIGMTVDSISPLDRRNYNIPAEIKGVLISSVEPMSEAAEKGLTPGDVIMEVNKNAVTDPASVPRLIGDAKKAGLGSVLLMINRGGDVQFVALKPKEGGKGKVP